MDSVECNYNNISMVDFEKYHIATQNANIISNLEITEQFRFYYNSRPELRMEFIILK